MTHRLSSAPGRRPLRRALLLGTLLSSLAGALLPAAQAQDAARYPDKPIRIIVPNPAGGASDVIGRLIAKELSEAWNQPVVVENKAGASGHIGAAMVAKAEPDGYTLLLLDMGVLTIGPSIMPSMTYSPTKDLTPVSIVAYSPHILVVRNDLPVTDLDSLSAYAKQHPGKLNFGATLGTITHLAGVQLAAKQGFDWNYIGYKGGAQAMADLAGGQIDAMMNSFLATYPLVKGEKIKMLAIASPQRFSLVPDTQTIGERIPGFVTGSWQGLLAPAGTPPAIVEKLHAQIAQIVQKPEIQQRFVELGSEPVAQRSEDIARWMQQETDYWAQVIREGNVKLD